MGNLCAAPSELIQGFKKADGRGSIDSLDVIIQKKGVGHQNEPITSDQKELIGLCHDYTLRKQFETKLKHENKIKHKIEALSNIEGFDYNGSDSLSRAGTLPSKKLLNAKVEVNKSKNVYQKEIEHEVAVHPETTAHVPIDPMNVLEREVGYYTAK
jgi:hypothetical protein